MKIAKRITRLCDECRVIRVRGRVVIKHFGPQRCVSRRTREHENGSSDA